MNYELPTSVTIAGEEYEIRSDYRAILDICTALTDPELNDTEKATIAMVIFYPHWQEIPKESQEEAIKNLFLFLNMGEEDTEDMRKRPKLVDWEQDFKYIIAPINKVSGQEIRALPYMHWWTFLAYYNEIDGESTFAYIVRIRDKLKRGKKLDETESRFYRENRNLVEFKKKYTDTEKELLEKWTNG